MPESWYSWRQRLAALADAGFHVVAPGMRGYGQTDRRDAIEQYTLFHLVGDMVGLVAALGVETVGHRGARLGRAGRVARGAAASRPLPRGHRAQRALSTARGTALQRFWLDQAEAELAWLG